MDPQGKFWLVWGEAQGNPTYKHATEEEAKAEAERLTRRLGGTFHVLELVATAERNDVKWTTHPHEYRVSFRSGSLADFVSSPRGR